MINLLNQICYFQSTSVIGYGKYDKSNECLQEVTTWLDSYEFNVHVFGEWRDDVKVLNIMYLI